MSSKKVRSPYIKWLREFHFHYQEGRCCWCEKTMHLLKPTKGVRVPDYYCTLEHIIPSSKDGLTNLLNTSASCRRCNFDKFDSEELSFSDLKVDRSLLFQVNPGFISTKGELRDPKGKPIPRERSINYWLQMVGKRRLNIL